MPKSPARQAALRKMLEDRQRDLREFLSASLGEPVDEGKLPLDPPKKVAPSDLDESEIFLIELQKESLRRIECALKDLCEGIYGNCFKCGEEIGEDRLRALPFAALCKACDDAKEMAKYQKRLQRIERRLLVRPK